MIKYFGSIGLIELWDTIKERFVKKESGKGLSSNDFTDAYKTKVDNALNDSDVTNKIATHNTATDSHNDIRDLIVGLTTRLNTLANSDDTTLDQMSEIVAYIKDNRELIESITTGKISVSDIVDNLTTNVSTKPLSASQGVVLKGLIDSLQTVVNTKVESSVLTNHINDKTNPHDVDKIDVGLGNVPNVTTNNQTPTYTIASANAELKSGETLTVAFGKIAKAISSLIAHLADTSNSHKVTASQVGLGNVNNTSDANKPVSTAQATAISNAVTESKKYTDDNVTDLRNTLEDKADKTAIPTNVSELTNDSGYITDYTETDPTVPAWAKASKKPTYTASEVGASPTGHKHSKSDISDFPTTMPPSSHTHSKDDITDFAHTHTASDVGAVPTTRKVNGKSLNADISLSASDVGARPNTWTPSASDVGASPTGHNHDDRYFTETEVTNKLAGKSDTGHTHDDRYYTESEIDTKLSGKSDTGHSHSYNDLSNKPTIPTKTSQLTNDSGFKTTDNNTTYTLTKSGSTITLTGSDGSTTSVTDSDNNTTYNPASTSLGLVKSGGDVTISSGVITVNDDSHNHVISNVDGLQNALDGKSPTSHTHDDLLAKSGGTMTGDITFSGKKGFKWSAINSKSPYIGWCTNSSDGTFIIGNLIDTVWNGGLAIGGSSGNLLWKGSKVAVTTDIPTKTSQLTNDSTYVTKAQLDEKAKKSSGVFYIEGTGDTAGTWLGTHSDITEYYDGLMVAYKVGVAGASGLTLNINNLGAVSVVRNATSAITTHYGVNSVVFLTYTVDSDGTAYWKTSDYDSDTKTRSSNKTASKMFIIGATTQSTSGQTTYSNSNCYIGTDNCLYSGGKKVAIASDIPTKTSQLTNDSTFSTVAEMKKYVDDSMATGSADLSDTTVFNSNGSITVNYEDGTSETTVFNADGSIVTTHSSGKVTTVTFNSDGSISTTYS